MARMKSAEVWALWRDRLRRFQSSGLTVTAFCDWEGVSQAAFYVWRKKLQADSGLPSRKTVARVSVSVQQHHLVFRSTSAFRQCLSSALGVSSFFTSALFAVGAVSTLILAVGANVIRMGGSPDVGTQAVVVR